MTTGGSILAATSPTEASSTVYRCLHQEAKTAYNKMLDEANRAVNVTDIYVPIALVTKCTTAWRGFLTELETMGMQPEPMMLEMSGALPPSDEGSEEEETRGRKRNL